MKIKLTQPQIFYLAILFSLMVALVLPGTALAHLDLKSSDPASGEVIE
jgi:methionine-rich copper-binding protein CopC